MIKYGDFFSEIYKLLYICKKTKRYFETSNYILHQRKN